VKQIFPGYHVRAITNGVHPATWTHPRLASLYQKNLPQWAVEPEVLERADQVPDEAIWNAHQEAKGDLLALIKRCRGLEMRVDVPLIAFARRMTAYKRPDLIFPGHQSTHRHCKTAAFSDRFRGVGASAR
jgi:starch phosphorylase